MNTKKCLMAVAIATAMAAPLTSTTAAQLGDLSDGATHVGGQTGYWSLFANAGDSITVTGLRLQAFDPIAVAWSGHIDPAGGFASPGLGAALGFGDDEIPGNNSLGGGFSDPQFSFTAGFTGEYTVGVFRCCTENIENLAYSVQATGSSFQAVPEPETYAMMVAGLGLLGFAARRRKAKAAA